MPIGEVVPNPDNERIMRYILCHSFVIHVAYSDSLCLLGERGVPSSLIVIGLHRGR